MTIMLQSLLANFAILLFMHLCIQSNYYLAFRNRVPATFVAVIHILIVTVGIIILYMLPVTINSYSFDLRTIPLVFLLIYHGFNYGFPVIMMVTLARFIFPGEEIVVEILFTIIIPSIVTLLFRQKIMEKLSYLNLFVYFTVVWFISDVMLVLVASGNEHMVSAFALRFLSFQLSAIIMYFFIHTSTKNLEMSEQLRFYAEHDSLTGLLNVRSFLKQVDEREGSVTRIVAMLDLDYFKVINDTYGHLNGDRVLAEFAHFLLKQDKSWVIGRYGGEEFIVLIDIDKKSEAIDKMKDLQSALSRHTFTTEAGDVIKDVSISIGLAELTPGESIMEAIERADQQLYKAKDNGRNQVWV
ncbi:diguanylate cyclase [Pseudalkalibacillus hwajinpoensis]|uniref:GGDEF domain-containing protein n=1 Tax=Guptibacillus hwajinpoensis TaxID=208199 RepID=UPI00325AFE2F